MLVATLGADEVIPTADTFEHIAEVAFKIVRDQAVIPTAGNAETQDLSQSDIGLLTASKVRNLINITATAIKDSRALLVPEFVEPVVESGYSSAVEYGSMVRELDSKTMSLMNISYQPSTDYHITRLNVSETLVIS